MERTKIAQIFADQEHFGGREVRISGWARTIPVSYTHLTLPTIRLV